MANSYGFDRNTPEDALYGVYDAANGEWTGTFFFDVQTARAAALDLHNDPDFRDHGVVSTTEDDDWLEPWL